MLKADQVIPPFVVFYLFFEITWVHKLGFWGFRDLICPHEERVIQSEMGLHSFPGGVSSAGPSHGYVNAPPLMVTFVESQFKVKNDTCEEHFLIKLANRNTAWGFRVSWGVGYLTDPVTVI